MLNIWESLLLQFNDENYCYAYIYIIYIYKFSLVTPVDMQNTTDLLHVCETTLVICLDSFGVLNKWEVYLQ